MPKRSEEHMLMRRRQILDAATRVFLRKGIHQASMRDICEESKLSTGAVYNHFASKQELIASHAEHGIAAKPPLLFDRLDEFREHVMTLLSNPSEEVHDMVCLEFQVFEESLRDDRIRAISAAGISNFVANNLLCLKHLSERGQLHPQYDIEIGARRISTLIFSILMFTHLKLEQQPGEFIPCIEQEFDYMRVKT